jgi:hypothetical protein
MNEILPFECSCAFEHGQRLRARTSQSGNKATLFAAAFGCRSGCTAIVTLHACCVNVAVEPLLQREENYSGNSTCGIRATMMLIFFRRPGALPLRS